MKLVQQILVLCLLLGSTYCLFENNSAVKPLTTIEQYEQLSSGSMTDLLSIVIYWHEDSERNDDAENTIKELVQQNDGLFSLFQVDCEFFSTEEISICGQEQEQIKRLPTIKLFAPPSSKINPITKKENTVREIPYEGVFSAKEIATFAKFHMPNYAIRRPSWNQLQTKILPELTHVKVVLFTNKNESAPLFKAITALYRYRIKFIEIHQSQEELVKQFQIKKFPTILLLKMSPEGKVESFEYQDAFKMSKITIFLDKFALKEKKVVYDPFEGLPNSSAIDNADKAQDDPSSQKFQSAFTEDENEKKKTKEDEDKVKVLNERKYEKNIMKEEGIVLIHVYSETEKIHGEFNVLIDKLGEIATYYSYLADTEEKRRFAENVLQVKSYPSIKMLPFKRDNSNYVYQANESTATILEEIDETTLDESVSLMDERNMQMLVTPSLQENLIVQILLHNKQKTPLSFRVAIKQAQYKGVFRFMSMRDPPQTLLNQFKISALPKVAFIFRNVQPEEKDSPLKAEQIQVQVYSGKLAYKEYSSFLNMFIQKEEERSVKPVEEIVNQDDLDRICKKRTKFCFLALLNGQPSERVGLEDSENDEDKEEMKVKTKLRQNLLTMNSVKEKLRQKPVQFGWIDAVCHSHILSQLEIYEDSIPNYILYNGTTKQFSAIVGRFELLNIEDFSLRALQGKTRLITLKNELSIPEKDCVHEHRKIIDLRHQYENQQASNDLDEEIKREILEEERLRKQEAQKELNADKRKKKRPSKGKKKTDL